MDTDDEHAQYVQRIEGTHLWLREFSENDWQAIHAWASRPDVCRFQAWGPNSPAETQSFLQTVLDAKAARPRTNFTLAATLPGQEVPIGSGSLYIRNLTFRTGEIAYILHPDYWGNGLGTELARLLLSLGFDQFGL